ncbi:hypothetical protein GOP47_0010356 [Adiantum capillus-veneris]|uniref:TH1 domain-containing protein n=1 Tax=Adiantum capillus-veneris TaxID=13818 RepID=A0A9D4ZIP1_ADICA|nr:hypothetical protein GOP47_0010356 [Adiantum capillus-veneris]
MGRRRVSIQVLPQEEPGEEEEEEPIRTELSKNTETQEPFMGIKARRRSSAYNQQFHGDYLNVASNHQIAKLLTKQGDKQVLFADSIMKVNRDGQMKRRIILITEAALYMLDNRWCNLKRRISLSAIDRIFLSELNDNFLSIRVASEYDCFLASTRKNEIVTVLVNTPRSGKLSPIQVSFANRFEYRVDSKTSRVVHFEEAEGGVKTTITRPEAMQS